MIKTNELNNEECSHSRRQWKYRKACHSMIFAMLRPKEGEEEDVIRKYLSLIDIEEYKLREKLLQEIDPAK